MKTNTTNTSVAEAVEGLKEDGYKREFRRDSSFIYCVELHLWMSSDEFKVDESYLFEDFSNPDADRVLYAISASAGIKGILVEGYGVYADGMSHEMAEKLSLNGPTYKSNKLTQYEYEKLRITHRRFS